MLYALDDLPIQAHGFFITSKLLVESPVSNGKDSFVPITYSEPTPDPSLVYLETPALSPKPKVSPSPKALAPSELSVWLVSGHGVECFLSHPLFFLVHLVPLQAVIPVVH
ncbi:hypothetical protein DSO57_1022141 [Entomophthora muscae]|uniref:Uncharacterized protein n=1 Tax=Entomophthora muscae TaxID=34485 RepID=A0ACC2UC72_9FUNG|nr:hypothetical protein DSO57_1022141 [Entomophthora muscae]